MESQASPSVALKTLPVVLLVLLVSWVAGLQIQLLSLPFAGGYHDDGVYLVTAKSLAEGEGYAIQSLPQALPQTKYPILFPTLLASVWKIQPDFPSNLPLLRLVPLVSSWLWLAATWWLLAVELGRRQFAGWVFAVALASPAVNYFGGLLLSESLFALLMTLSLIVILRLLRQPQASLRLVVGAALLCALTFHTRTIGVTLLPPALLVFARQRQWWRSLGFVSIFLLAASPWWIWQAAHSPPFDPILDYYTKRPYSEWSPIMGNLSISPVVLVIWNMLFAAHAPFFLFQFKVSLPYFGWLALAVPVLLGFGAARTIKTPQEPITAFLACYLGVTLLWPWPPYRFLVPVLPLLILTFSANPLWVRHRNGRIVAKGLATALVLWGVAASTINANHSRAEGVLQGAFSADAASWSERSEAYRWIQANTGTDQVLAANLDPSVWLYCRRKAVRAFAVDPVELFYRPGQATQPLGSARVLAARLIHHKVDYLVFESSALFAETRPLRTAIDELVQSCPGALQRVFVSTMATVEIYRMPSPSPTGGAGTTFCSGPPPVP